MKIASVHARNRILGIERPEALGEDVERALLFL
jgi:hypothetical protein